MAGPVPYAGASNAQKGKSGKSSGGGNSGPSWLEKALHPNIDIALNPHKQQGTLAQLIEAQAASQKHQAEAANAAAFGGGNDQYQNLQNQLFSAINGVQAQTTPLAQLQQMANQQVGAQFDPQIQGLISTMKSKQKRGLSSEKTARDMYGAMSKDFLAQLPELTNQFKQEDQATNARYDQAQSQMQGEYSKQAADQNAVLKKLGVQAASQDASQQAMDDQAYFQNQSNLDQQNALTAQDQQQNTALNYQRDLSSNSRMAGENTAQDIATQLEDYLTQAQGQLTGLRGQKSSAIAALVNQMQSQDQQNAEKVKQQNIDNLMSMFNFQLSAQKAGDSAANKASASQGGLFKGTSGLSGASNYLAQQYPDQPILAKNLMQQLNDVLSNPDVVKGKFVLDQGNPSLGQAPKYSNVGQEYMMDLLRQQFEKSGSQFSTGNINDTMNALMAYLGKLR